MSDLAVYVFMFAFGLFVVFMGLMILLAFLVRMYQMIDTMTGSDRKCVPSDVPCGSVADLPHATETDGDQLYEDDGIGHAGTAAPALGTSTERVGQLVEELSRRF